LFFFLDDTRLDFTNKFNYVFWLGDLNYRLTLPFETVCATIYGGHEVELLYKADQLKNEMAGNTWIYSFAILHI